MSRETYLDRGPVVDGEPAIGGVLCLGYLTVTEVVAINLCGLPGEIDRTVLPRLTLLRVGVA